MNFKKQGAKVPKRPATSPATSLWEHPHVLCLVKACVLWVESTRACGGSGSRPPEQAEGSGFLLTPSLYQAAAGRGPSRAGHTRVYILETSKKHQVSVLLLYTFALGSWRAPTDLGRGRGLRGANLCGPVTSFDEAPGISLFFLSKDG